jgi:hypothetical protein
MGNEAEAQVAALQAVIYEKSVQSIDKDIAAAVLRSPVDGVVLTKDIELHTGEFIQLGSPFAEVAGVESWDLLVEINEKKIGKVEQELAKGKPLPVNYILYSQSAHQLHGELANRQQMSAMAYSREKENVFILTLRDIQVPPEMRKDLRPGLTGRAKVSLGREPLAWWSGKAIVDWLRLKLLH